MKNIFAIFAYVSFLGLAVVEGYSLRCDNWVANLYGANPNAPGFFGILELPDDFALPTIPPGVTIEPIPMDSPVVVS